MPDFGIFRGFNDKLFGNKLYAGQLPTQLGTIGSKLAYDVDAQAFFDRVTAAGGSLTTTEQIAINQLVLDMKSYSIWSKMKAIYPMVGASAAACSQNLKSSSFTGTFTSGWTYASTGVTPNGTSAYMNPSFNPSLQLTNSSGHFSYYSRSNTAAGNKYEIGCYDGTNGNGLLIRHTANINYFVYGTFTVTISNTDSRGFYVTNRNSTTNTTGFKNGTKVRDISSTGVAVNNLIYIGAELSQSTTQGFTDRECAFVSLGDGLSDTEASNFYTAVQAFQTTLSRQV